jgi:hypothetical protein
MATMFRQHIALNANRRIYFTQSRSSDTDLLDDSDTIPNCRFGVV